ncbi:MAG TPA: glycoside hydrolase family 2 TIM barrel-domain containing protein [Acidobacteriaceae bacterium]|nr:glycoside hydrolase family 2 TIM barrel-domain containing protein [Acidobacteriaceae bacterium]
MLTKVCIRHLLRSLLLTLATATAYGETVGGTPAVDLGGRWDFRFDANAAGEQSGWYKADAAGPWQTIQVPGSYNDQFDGKRDYAGKGWYRTRFSVSTGTGDQAVLRLGAVVLRARVWVNGELAGATVLPLTPVEFDITRLLRKGGKDNLLVIETDNAKPTKGVLDLGWNGWQNDGGLVFPVKVIVHPAIYSVTHVTTTMGPSGSWNAGFEVVVHHHSAKRKVNVSAAIMDGEKTIWKRSNRLELNGEQTALSMSASLTEVQAWSPETPHLYRWVVRVGGAKEPREELLFGFRQVEVHGASLTLNGKPLLLRGINRHSFYPGVGMSVPAAQTEKDFNDIKALGANFVRLAHYAQPEEVYELCDRLGLLVWTEIPVWQTKADNLTDPAIWSDTIRPMLEASVTQHWNHPSVIVWSVANEIPTQKPEVADTVSKEIAYVKSLDSTRLVTFASDRREKDVSFGPVDFIAINEYFGWYYGKSDDLGAVLDQLHEKYPDKAIFVSEYGSESVAGWTPALPSKPGAKNYSLEFQAHFLESHMEQIYAPERRSFMIGGAPWLYNDFPLPVKGNVGDHPESLAYVNAKGLVTQQREHKPAYFTVQHFYRQLEGSAPAK